MELASMIIYMFFCDKPCHARSIRKISLSYWNDVTYHTLVDVRFFASLRMTGCFMSF
ncbi:MAG: hypothetical protein PWR04_1275 [Anaerophaga sp.]|nr:hypothetical protein [Anaerophaga sp.]